MFYLATKPWDHGFPLFYRIPSFDCLLLVEVSERFSCLVSLQCLYMRELFVQNCTGPPGHL